MAMYYGDIAENGNRTGCNITIYNMGTFPVDVVPSQLKFCKLRLPIPI